MYSHHWQPRVILPVVCLAPLLLHQLRAQAPPPADAQDTPFVLHINAREAVIEVVATDQHNNPVNDLKQDEFQVFDAGKHADKTPRQMLSMRMIDPHSPNGADASDNGFRISSGAVCALNATTHYQLAIQAAPEPGYHDVLVKTTRPKVRLSYRKRYYIGPTPDQVHARDRRAATEDVALGEAACWHASTPATLAVTARPLLAQGGGGTRYMVTVKSDSFPDIGFSESNLHVGLDFGMCTFDATGAFVQYLHSTVDRPVDAAFFAKAKQKGLSNVLELPGVHPPDLARLVVRDRVTGNLGVVDVSRPVSLAAQGDQAKAIKRPIGSVRSFGVITPRENDFCGDVYELSSGAAQLPDFWNLDPVGSIYTDKLEVWDQDINQADGIPGVTHTNLWFGVDYYGEFYISKPGEYAFELQADDGARLEIDHQSLVDLDGLHPVLVKTAKVTLTEGLHTIHVPYFQGTPTRLAMVLQVKPPGEGMRVFNITEFAPPKSESASGTKAKASR
ncbi:PA14 domain-containing protein [Occallatibacter riparius]|uniref:PA14 domain-containing protein n=1 Tax=Occallatibacter riparius TaxID=1002689 RepID=A0A9J7BSZ7_9BACT|nr:PA14 domain-containing protein [Occallatibacter riparius]UWZ86027.1 PA14 domain-containing protein [Occallatibacter riparius]